VAGVEDDPPVPPKEDTLRETPVSKGPISRPSMPDDWKAPPRRKEALAKSGEGAPEEGARVDFGFGAGRVHTFQVSGPLAFVLALVVLAVVGVIFALVSVFAIGIGAALVAGTAVAAVLGVGVAKVRGKLAGRSAHKLDAGDPEP